MLVAVILVSLAVFADAAPRSKSKGPQLVYDQKQKGDYNVQVHLKDFQIIALVGDDPLGDAGDYEYNYDYSDFTVKPESSSSTVKPLEISSTTIKASEVYITSTATSEKSSTSLKPNNEETIIGLSTSVKPLELGEQKPAEPKPSSDAPIIEKDKESSTTEQITVTTKKESISADAIPGQIQVQVIHTPETYPNISEKKEKTEEAAKANDKKCTSGFSRDKRGRCRRVRRPQSAMPFNFGRLVNLASRFRANIEEPTKILKHPHSI